MDYLLKQRVHQKQRNQLLPIPPRARSSQLRQGGGRKDSPGWTDHKRRSNRKRFDQLRCLIKTCVTFVYPNSVTPLQLVKLNELHRNFCKEHHIPARCVWEGPGKHQHIALGITFDADLSQKWSKRLAKRWQTLFGGPMPDNTMLWNPDVEPEKIASYLSKTRDQITHYIVKGSFDWLTFSPVWETGFRKATHDAATQTLPPHDFSSSRKNEVIISPEKESHPIFPIYTVRTPEKESDLKNSRYTLTVLIKQSDDLEILCLTCVFLLPS